MEYEITSVTMKTKLIILMLLFQMALSYSQSASKEIKDAVAKEFNQWLEKGQFEKNGEYESRMKKADEKLQAITNEITASIKTKYLERRFKGT